MDNTFYQISDDPQTYSVMTVSVIIATYNRAHLIRRAVMSVLNQHYSYWELLIIDDGSTDDTEDKVSVFLEDPRVKYFKKGNTGAADTRNYGVNLAKGDFVTFLDSDDEAQPRWLVRMVEALLSEDAAIACCGWRKFDQSGQALNVQLPSNLGPMYGDVVGLFIGGCFVCQRDLFLEAGGFDRELRSNQHTEFAMRLVPLALGRKLNIVSVFEPLVYVHIHGGPRIRYDHDAIYLGTIRTLRQHATLLLKDRKKKYDYFAVAGVAAVRTKRYSEAIMLFYRAFQLFPTRPHSWVRLLVSCVPKLRDLFWNVSLKPQLNDV